MSAAGPLDGTLVVDLSRNAPGPYASMLLARLGARVLSVGGGPTGEALPELSAGKHHLTLDLRDPAGARALESLVSGADVLLESFRPGVLDRLGLGYGHLSAINPRLVHCALTGYGQDGPLSRHAGHDINYLALTGVMAVLGPKDRPPTPPVNLVADMGGGGLWAAFAILSGLLERQRTGRGRFLDASMVDGVLSMMGTWFTAWGTSTMPARGEGIVSGETPFYRCYRCADGRWVAVGAIEPKFFAELWRVLEMEGDVPDHLDVAGWEALTDRLERRFTDLDRDEWAARASADSCLTPVLDPDEVSGHPHHAARLPQGGDVDPASLFPHVDWIDSAAATSRDDETEAILRSSGLDEDTVRAAVDGAERVAGPALSWPPMH